MKINRLITDYELELIEKWNRHRHRSIKDLKRIFTIRELFGVAKLGDLFGWGKGAVKASELKQLKNLGKLEL